MKLTIKFSGRKINKDGLSKALDSAIQLLMRNAARAFVEAATSRVPVRTGFARGSLLNLSSAIGLNAASNPGNFLNRLGSTLAKRVRTFKPAIVEYYQGVLKTPENARQFSTSIEEVFTRKGNVYSFNYYQTITYYLINDVYANPRTPSSPWGSFEAGRTAFLQSINDNYRNIPKVTDYIVKSRV